MTELERLERRLDSWRKVKPDDRQFGPDAPHIITALERRIRQLRKEGAQ